MSKRNEREDELYLNVHFDGRITVEGKILDEEELRRRLQRIDEDTWLMIRCDRRVPWRVPAGLLRMFTEPEIRQPFIYVVTVERGRPEVASEPANPTQYGEMFWRPEWKVPVVLPRELVDPGEIGMVVELSGASLPEEDIDALDALLQAAEREVVEGWCLLDADQALRWGDLVRIVDILQGAHIYDLLVASPGSAEDRAGRILLNGCPVVEVSATEFPPLGPTHPALKRILQIVYPK